ncbi:MAG: M48 family metallopeptidase [Peptococcaceae bacterium]
MEIEIIYKNKKNSSGLIRDGKILLYISSNLPVKQQQEHIRILKNRLLAKYQARQNTDFPLAKSRVNEDDQLAKLAKEINNTYYNFTYHKVSFKQQQSRWGSCSLKTKNIYISQRLKNAPLELIYYVLVHELCHLREPNHGKKFWQLVEKACPNWKELRSKLKFLN